MREGSVRVQIVGTVTVSAEVAAKKLYCSISSSIKVQHVETFHFDLVVSEKQIKGRV